MSRRIRLTLPFFFLLFCSQYENAVAHNNPYNSPAQLVRRMRAVSDFVSSDPTFSTEQIADICAIHEGLISLIEEFTRSGMMNQIRLQAIRKAASAAVAEIVVIEGNSSLYQKTNAIVNAIRNVLLQTTGTINETVISEMIELINMFARDMSRAPSTNDWGSSGPGQYSYGQGIGPSGLEKYGSSTASAIGQLGPVKFGSNPESSVERGGSGFGTSGPGAVQPGQGLYGSSEAFGSSSAATSAASVSVPYDLGPAVSGPRTVPTGTEISGPGTVQPGLGPYVPSAAYRASSASVAVGAGPYGPDSAQPSGTSILPMDIGTVSNSVSRLSSSSSSARVSSAVSTLLSSGGVNPLSLGRVIADLSNSVSLSHPGLSGCEALVQVLLEVTTSLVHIFSSSSFGQLSSSPDYSSSVVGQLISNTFGS